MLIPPVKAVLPPDEVVVAAVEATAAAAVEVAVAAAAVGAAAVARCVRGRSLLLVVPPAHAVAPGVVPVLRRAGVQPLLLVVLYLLVPPLTSLSRE